jgi:hypothetical protein
MDEITPSEFEKAAGQPPGDGLLIEFWYFLRYNKKWWLLPILIVMLLASLLLLVSTTAAGPFIYTLF